MRLCGGKKYIVYYIQQKAVLIYNQNKNNKNNFKIVFVRDSHVKNNNHAIKMNFEISLQDLHFAEPLGRFSCLQLETDSVPSRCIFMRNHWSWYNRINTV